MSRFQYHHDKAENSYNWQGVMEFLYNQYQNNSQKQNIWALQRNSFKQNIKQLEGKLLALQNINKELKTKNNILQHSLRQIKIKNHENRNKNHQTNLQKQNRENNIQKIDQLPKVPQRRPKPNKANLSRMLCSLGIPQLLQDIRKDISHNQTDIKKPLHTQIKKGLQLDLSKMQAQSRNTQNFEKKINYQQIYSLQGHNDGVRDLCFVNSNHQLKQIISVSQDCTMKVWNVQKKSLNKIDKVQCVQTIRDHIGPIFACIEGDGYVFTGGMEGVIRAYNFRNQNTEKQKLVLKWKTNDDEKVQPLWQLLYDKNNKLLISTCSEMVIKAYKIPQIQDDKHNSQIKMKPYCKFLYKVSSYESQEYQQFIPTAVCLSNQKLVASYFNSSSLVNFDIQTQKIVNQLNYKIQGNLSANKLLSHPRCIIGAYEDCNIRIFDQKKVTQSFKAHNQPVMSIANNLNNSNNLFSCGQDGYVKLWDIRKLKDHIWSILGHKKRNDQAAHCIQTNSDGITISGGADNIIKVYTPIY